jgi:hypothetical protein
VTAIFAPIEFSARRQFFDNAKQAGKRILYHNNEPSRRSLSRVILNLCQRRIQESNARSEASALASCSFAARANFNKPSSRTPLKTGKFGIAES